MSVKRINPFSSSRVDTPFQRHLDLKEIYHNEFLRLQAIIEDIEHDSTNHQSKGAVVIGTPGSGKTHLMMRLAQARLKMNRLFFIRQPNHLNSVLYHIYSRVLESFAQTVPGSHYSQIEHFLANTFSNIIKAFVETSESEQPDTSGLFGNLLFARRGITYKYKDILEISEKNPLDIYHKLGKEGSDKKRDYWQRIEKVVVEWWKQNYSDAGHATAIIQGIVKFCSYSEPKKRELVGKWLAADELEEAELEEIGLKNWQEEMGRENFSLEALTVFGKLSVMDEPLIIVFDQLEALGLTYNENLLHSFGEAIKELFTHVPNSLIILNLFPDRWEHFKQFFDGAVIDRISQCQIVLNRPADEQLKDMLIFKAQSQQVDVESLFTPESWEHILDQETIRGVLNWASHYFRYYAEKIPLPNESPATPDVQHPTVNFEQTVKNEFATFKAEIKPSQLSFEQDMRAGLNELKEEIITLRQTFSDGLEALKRIYLPVVEQISIKQQVSDNKSSKKLSDDKPMKKGTKVILDSVRPHVVAYLEREKSALEANYNNFTIITDADDFGKLRAIMEAFRPFRNLELDCLRLGKKVLPEHILISHQGKMEVIGFLHIKGTSFTTRLQNFNQLVINYPETKFTLFRDAREPPIVAKVGASEIEKLRHTSNGDFLLMEKENRIIFELLTQLVTDILNKEEDFSLQEAFETVTVYFKDYWLIDLLT